VGTLTDGLIKHLVHKKMRTRECCIEAYMQFLKEGGCSGKHRHMSEELFFVVEGSGDDLHWNLKWDCRKRSNGNGRRNRRDLNGRAGITYTPRRSRCISILPMPAKNAASS